MHRMAGLSSLIALCVMTIDPLSATAAPLLVGFGQADITPDPGSEIPGFLEKRIGTRVSDPLYAVTAVFESAGERVAIVGIDALCIGADTVTSARQQITQATGISTDHILIGASHTHTGGPIRPSLDGTIDEKYMKHAIGGIVLAATKAWRAREPVEIGIGSGQAPGLAFNRRFLMRDGREITHPGKPGTQHHADIVRPAGPVDNTVGVLVVRRPDGTMPGALVNFGCHNTVMSNETFSADYVGALRRHLAAQFGPEFATVFLLGPCGDINQIDNLSAGDQGGAAYCDWFGGKLANAVRQALGGAKWMAEAPIAAVDHRIEIQIRPEPDAQRERPAYGLGSGPEAFFEHERQLVAEERNRDPNVSCEFQGIRIGPLGIVTNGGELFCDYGLRIKACSRHEYTWVSTLTNQWLGYIPTANAFAAGGYEPRTRRGSKLVFDAGQRMVEASLEVLGSLSPATRPAQ